MKKTITKTEDKNIRLNLNHWFRVSSSENRHDGANWYSDARTFTIETAKKFGVDRYKVAAVVSALSPNNKWQRNKVDCVAVINAWKAGLDADSVKVCTYGANKRKAFRILDGELISESSPKTHAFAMNIAHLSDSHITIDKWHIRACLCSPDQGIVDTVETITAKQYRRIERITAEIARDHGYKGFEFQAIIWVSIKESWGR